jgi:hypothetical protein
MPTLPVGEAVAETEPASRPRVQASLEEALQWR